MSNELMRFDAGEFGVMQSMAKSMVDSGFFSDTKQVAQAMVKIQAGRELGLPPFASMTGIHIVQGKPVLGANLIATLVKNSGRYDYRIKALDNQSCVLEWYENGKPVGEAGFTMQEANAAGLTNKPTWKAYPSDMLFARALTRGARRYAPGIFGGAPIYTPEEIGVEVDADGVIIQGEVIDVTPPAPQQAQATNGKPKIAAPTAESGPLPDDEQVVYEAPGKEFVTVAAAILETDTDTIKERLHALGYDRIPGDKGKRLDAFRQLRDTAAVQDDLFGEMEPPPAAMGAYQE